MIFCGTGAMTINEVTGGDVTHVGIGITWGLIVMAMIYAFGETSGAHFNPAVTIAFAYAKKFAWKEVPKYIIFQIIGIFKPTYRQTRLSDMRIVAQKSAGLAAENFMISMAAIGYDTCPMEGCDTLRVKRILGLPSGAEINMVISCGIRDDKGVYGPRFRVPFDEVYKTI